MRKSGRPLRIRDLFEDPIKLAQWNDPCVEVSDLPSRQPRRESFLRPHVWSARHKMRKEGWEKLTREERQLAVHPQVEKEAGRIRQKMFPVVLEQENLVSAGMAGIAYVLFCNPDAGKALLAESARGFVRSQISAEIGVERGKLDRMRACSKLWDEMERRLSQELQRKPELAELEVEFASDPEIAKKREKARGFKNLDFEQWRLYAQLYGQVTDSIADQNNSTYRRAVNRSNSLTCSRSAGLEEELQTSWEQRSKFWATLEETLTPREFYIVARHAGLEHSFEKIGADLGGIGRKAVENKFLSACRRVRGGLIARILRDFQNNGDPISEIKIDPSVHLHRTSLMQKETYFGEVAGYKMAPVTEEMLTPVRAALREDEGY